MQADMISLLFESLSEARLRPYGWKGPEDVIACLGRYAYNIALSEALYPALSYLEVTLRNKVHAAASEHFGDPLWFMTDAPQLDEGGREAVEEVRQRLETAKKPIEADRMVAELSFGFWTSLFNGRYEHTLWRPAIHRAFPHAPAGTTRKKVQSRLNKIRSLRNRVFHHEPIWHWQDDLDKYHTDILNCLDWMNPAMRRAVELTDRFPEVRAAGELPHQAQWQLVLSE